MAFIWDIRYSITKYLKKYKKAVKCNKMTYEWVLPRDHWRNITEKGIQVAKAHLILLICRVNKNFPIHIWDRFLPQIEMDLNMLWPWKLVPTISAWVHLHGQHDYNAFPLAPVGCAVEMHMQPEICKSFGAHSIAGFHVGTSLEHYTTREDLSAETTPIMV